MKDDNKKSKAGAAHKKPETQTDKDEISKLVEAEVEKRLETEVTKRIAQALQGQAPKASPPEGAFKPDKEAFGKMTYRERLKLYQNDPQTYQQLKGGD